MDYFLVFGILVSINSTVEGFSWKSLQRALPVEEPANPWIGDQCQLGSKIDVDNEIDPTIKLTNQLYCQLKPDDAGNHSIFQAATYDFLTSLTTYNFNITTSEEAAMERLLDPLLKMPSREGVNRSRLNSESLEWAYKLAWILKHIEEEEHVYSADVQVAVNFTRRQVLQSIACTAEQLMNISGKLPNKIPKRPRFTQHHLKCRSDCQCATRDTVINKAIVKFYNHLYRSLEYLYNIEINCQDI